MSQSESIRVLLVTDSPIQREFARRILSLTDDMEVTVAADGLEGLELAESLCPDVIILDAVLPVLSGIELLRRYRERGGRAKALVTVLSGRPAVRAAAFAAGADLVLLSPVQWGELIRHIRFLAGGFAAPCRRLLVEMGAPERWAGTDQAAICAGFLAGTRSTQLKAAYVEAASRHSTDVACVEVNIRRGIKELHDKATPAYRALGLPPGERPPANKDCLLSLAQAVKIPV